jgi:S1-C subfamily serine protease
MNLLDLVLIVVIIAVVVRWVRIGLVQGLFSLGGVLLGLLIGVLVAPFAMKLFDDATMRFLVALAVIVLIAGVIDSYCEVMGHKLSTKIEKPAAIKLNSILGGAFAVFAVLVSIWLAAAMLAGSPSKALNNQIQNSAIVQALNRNLPAAPPVVARLNGLIQPLDFPQVFVGPPPKLSEPVAPAGSATVQAAVRSAGRSTVRIEALGCGGVQAGSGWVAREGMVLTNAHVVSGTRSTQIVDTAGRHDATVVYFDPDLDVAVLRTDGDLAGQPLSVASQLVGRGSEAVILGFPGGGEFHAEAAAIARQIDAKGLNIYGTRTITRSIYELQGRVVQGDSGGPVVQADGTVVGMTFAAAEDSTDIGYALTSPQLIHIINATAGYTRAVSTQACSR